MKPKDLDMLNPEVRVGDKVRVLICYCDNGFEGQIATVREIHPFYYAVQKAGWPPNLLTPVAEVEPLEGEK